MTDTKQPVLELRGITKRFPGVIANKDVNLSIYPGEVLALLGENGAGKSTLMSVLYGLYRPEEGQILLKGEPVVLNSPIHALGLGIGLVPQHPLLVKRHTVLENLALASKKFLNPTADIAGKLDEVAQHYHLPIEPHVRVEQLSAGEKQRLEIVRVLLQNAKILILDEPTSVLTPQEAGELFKIMRTIKQEGGSLIFISHKLDEVMEISDRVVVLRKGQVTGTIATKDANKAILAEMMVGRAVSFDRKKFDEPTTEVVAEVSELQAMSDKGVPALKRVNLKVHRGEVLGVAGVAGNGQSELVEVLAGLRPVTGGTITLAGQNVTGANPKTMYNKGVAHIPEDRIKSGTVPSMTVYENMALRRYNQSPFAKGGMLDSNAVVKYTEEKIKEFAIATPSTHTQSRLLSGGNIQKVILARELEGKPELILAVHPTYGLDVGATEQVHDVLLKKAKEGAGVMLVSEDLDEILMLADSIAVICHGEVQGPFKVGSVTREHIGIMMTGGKV